MEAPRVLEEEAEMLRHGVVAVEEVREGRPLRAGRMRSLERLVELLRIAEKDDRACRAAPSARTFASAICPASSMKSTSTISRLFSAAQSQAVPAATLNVRAARPILDLPLLSTWVTRIVAPRALIPPTSSALARTSTTPVAGGEHLARGTS